MSETTALTPEIIETIKRKHGRLTSFRLERGGQEMAVRAPTPDELERAMDKASDGGRKKTESQIELGESCIVFPEAADVRKLAEEWPGLYFSAGGIAFEMAGVTDGYGVKKL